MRIEHALDITSMDRDDLAARLTEITGTEWSYRMVHNLIGGSKLITADIVWALHKATGLPYAFFLDDPRDMLNEAKGAQLRSDRADRTYLGSERYVIPDWHPANLLVKDEWHYRDEIQGQTELVIDLTEYAKVS